MAVPLMAQPALLESLRETVVSRWDFQTRFPGAAQLFANSAGNPERLDLVTRLRASQPQPVANPGVPTFGDLWADFAMGLALEKNKAGEGEADLSAAAQLAKGNIAVNYELARILIQSGMNLRAKAFQVETHRSMLEKGYLRIPELAKLELLHSREAMSLGRFQPAREYAEFAARLDPFCPWVPFLLMEMELREKRFLSWDLGAAWARLGETFRLLRYYDAQSLLLINLSRSVRAGLGFFAGIALLALFGRYFLRITHAWAERLPHLVELRVRYLALALLFLSLAVGGLGYAGLALVMIMLIWKHAASHEKSFLKLVMMGMALAPILLTWEQSMGRHLDDTLGLNLYHRAYARGYETPLIDRLNSYRPRSHEDSLYRSLAYSLAYKKQGNYLKAAEYGRAAAQAEPNSPYSLLNTGNLAMIAYDYPAASVSYSEARRVAPDMMEVWFNSSQAELYSNNSSLHKKYLDRAAEEDPQWVTQFLNENDEHFPQGTPTRKVMDAMLRIGQAWTAAGNAIMGGEFLRVPMRMGIFSIPGGWLIAAVACVGLALYFRFRHYSHSTHGKDLFDCKICGRIMCRLCRKGVHCQMCFKTVSGIHENRVKMEMVQRMRSRATLEVIRTGAILNSLMPGSGFLYLGQRKGRFVWTLATGLLIGFLWQANHLLMEYPSFVLGPWRWLPWLPLAVMYGLFNLKLIRSPLNLAELNPSSNPVEKEAFR